MPAFSISSGLSVTPSASAVGFPASFFSAAGDGACGADGACWHPANSRKVTHDTVSPGAGADAPGVHPPGAERLDRRITFIDIGFKLPAPSATQRLAERDQAVKARQLVLRELVPGGIERSLQLEQRQEVPRAPLVPHPGTFERTFAFVDVDPLELFNGLQVLESRKCLLDIDQRGEDRLPIRCQQL